MSVLGLVRAVAGKELVDGLRDRRTLLMALAFPLLGPIVLTAAFSLVSREARSTEEDGVRLPVMGREHAPALVAFLAEGRITIVDPPPDPEAAVRAGQAEAVLVIPPEFGARLRAGEPAPLRLIVDESRGASSAMGHGPADRVLARLDGWARQTAAQRLILRGVHPLVVAPLAIERRDVSTSASRAAVLFSVMPYFLVMAIFIGGMAVAIDTTAGERERQSLEPLLATPASRGALISGKILATAVFTLASLLVTLLAYRVAFAVIPVESLDMTLEVSARSLVMLLVVILPIILLGASVLTALAAFARSHREAQGYLPVLIFLPMVPTLFLMVAPVRTQLWMLAVPFLGQNQLILRVLRGETIHWWEWTVSLGVGFALVALVWFVAARLYHREQLATSA